MNLYLLRNSQAQGWGEDSAAILVAADSEEEARRLAEENKDNIDPDGWNDPEVTTSQHLGAAASDIKKGIVSSF